MKKLSCGIIVLNQCGEILLGHVTGNDHYDIFKGEIEPNETPIDCAIRECYEETGILFNKKNLRELGLFNYTKKKNIHLFITKVNTIDISLLKCKSIFKTDSGELFPEIDWYEYVKLSNIKLYCPQSLANVLLSVNLETY